MEVETKKVGELKGLLENPRKISPAEMEKLKNSIKRFGVVEPIVWNKQTQRIVGGHQRAQAIIQCYGPDYLVSVVVVNLPDAEEKALNIALNKISGEWDLDKLSTLLDGLDESMLSVTGFEDKEIENLRTFGDIPEVKDLLAGKDATQFATGAGLEKLNIKGKVVGERMPLIFMFQTQEQLNRVAEFFRTKDYDWKGKEPNTNLLIHLVDVKLAEIKQNIVEKNN